MAIIVGGGDWYRFFGAGEQMAQMDEQGSLYPATLTFVIACVLATWSAYAFSAANVIRKLPFTKIILLLISLIFLSRGLLAIPVVMYADSPYMAELANNMTFMLVTSLTCLVIGSLYASGTYRLFKQQ
nr:hypothetical protein [Shewanella sairae]